MGKELSAAPEQREGPNPFFAGLVPGAAPGTNSVSVKVQSGDRNLRVI